MKRYTVTKRWFSPGGESVAQTMDCDELPCPLYDAPYVSVRLNEPVTRESLELTKELA